MSGLLRYETADGVATLTLNRPERRNAVSMDLFEALGAAIERAGADPAVRVLVLTGAGDHFCVGSDMTGPHELRVIRGGEDDAERLLRVSGVVTALRGLGKPSVAVVRGGCAGAGLSLALACDLRYAARDAVFNTAFLAVAVSGDLGMCWLLTHSVGPARARELMLLPGKLTAEQAESAGLVTALAGRAELDGVVAGVTARLAASAPLAVAAVRRNLDAAVTLPLADYLPGEVRRMAAVSRTADAAEARAAFAERRTPSFTGT